MNKILSFIIAIAIHILILYGIYCYIDSRFKSISKEDHFNICLSDLNTLLKKTGTYYNFDTFQKNKMVLVLLAGKDTYNIDYKDVLAIIATESDFRIQAFHKNENGSYDYGLTQVNSPYMKYRYQKAKKILNRYNLAYTQSIFDPYVNIMSAYVYLNDIKHCINKDDNYKQFIVAYNVGINGSTYKKLEPKMNKYFNRFLTFRESL